MISTAIGNRDTVQRPMTGPVVADFTPDFRCVPPNRQREQGLRPAEAISAGGDGPGIAWLCRVSQHVIMATVWVIYSEGRSSDGTEPRGMLHLLDAGENRFTCGALTPVHEWSPEVAAAALAEKDPSTVDMCPVCEEARAADA